MEKINYSGLSGRAVSAIDQFVTMIKSFQVELKKKDAYDLAALVGKSTGILKELYNDKSVEGLSRYENIQELLNSIKEFTDSAEPEPETGEISLNDISLGSYLQQVTLLTDLDNEEGEDVPRVKLMTIHSAKGLEFPVVFVVGMEENLFPSMMSMNSREDLEEERRLFYVAITRAMKRLVLSYANMRYRFGNLMYCEPSRFLEEVPEEMMDVKGNTKPSVSTKPPSHRPEGRKSLAEQFDKVRKASYNHTVSDDFSPDDPADMQTGMDVEHPRFGFGKIVSLEGNPDNKIAHVFFKEAGTKRIMLKYAKLQILKDKPLDS